MVVSDDFEGLPRTSSFGDGSQLLPEPASGHAEEELPTMAASLPKQQSRMQERQAQIARMVNAYR